MKQNRELRAEIDRLVHEVDHLRRLLTVHAADTDQCPLAASPQETVFYQPVGTGVPEKPPCYRSIIESETVLSNPTSHNASSNMFFVPSPSESASTATTSRPVSYASGNQSRRDSRDFPEQVFADGEVESWQETDTTKTTANTHTLPFFVSNHQAEGQYVTQYCPPIGNSAHLQQPYTTAVEAGYYFTSNTINHHAPTPTQQPQNVGWLMHGSDDPLLSETILAQPALSEKQRTSMAFAESGGEVVCAANYYYLPHQR